MHKWIGIVWIRTMPIFCLLNVFFFCFQRQYFQDGCMVPIATRLILHGGSQGAFIEREEKRRRQCRKWEEEVVLSLASRLHCRWDSPVVSVSMAQLTKEADAHSLSHTMHFTHSPGHFGNVYIVCARLAETSYVGAEIVWNNIARIKQAICRPMSCVILAFKWKAKLTTGFIMVIFDRLQ